MQRRQLGWTDLNLTTIGLGSWAIGGGGWKFSWGPQDDQASISTIHRAFDIGINWIDTAAIYGFGHSEEIVGTALKEMRHLPIVATKCSRLWKKDGNIFGNLQKESIRIECEASLKRLRIEVIDLYQIHWPIPDEDVEEGWETVADLIKEGKVRYGGVSNFNIEQLKRIQKIHPVASIQPPYSMLQRGIEKELLGYCLRNKIGVIVYSPMQKGLLTGKISRERIENLPQDDHRRNDPLFKDPLLTANLNLVEKLSSIAKEKGRTVAQLAIAWVLSHPAVTAAIVGARHTSQIEETFSAGDWILSREDIGVINGLLGQLKETKDLGQFVKQWDE